jgi:hypothetical protein
MRQAVRYALNAGFSPDGAAMFGAVGTAESGRDPDAQGDLGLVNGTWGPSVGMEQIRTLRAQTGTGGDRDIVRLLGHPAEQAKASLDISNGGTNWNPWTTARNGAFQQFLPAARAAVAQEMADPGSPAATAPTPGPVTASPVGLSVSDAVGPIKDAAVYIGGVLVGLGLITVGVIRLGGF